jgi:hypothetical protein
MLNILKVADHVESVENKDAKDSRVGYSFHVNLGLVSDEKH